MDKARVKIFRYTPGVDKSPMYREYLVPYVPRETRVLGALQYIQQNLDSSLAIRYGCRWKCCGTCALVINGEPSLACASFLEEKTTLDPLRGFPVIRDLIVDSSSYRRKVSNLRPFVQRTSPPVEEPEPLDLSAYSKYEKLSGCVDCLSCVAACPSYEVAPSEFAGPLAFTMLARRLHDSRDDADRARMAMSEGLFLCSTCGKCKEVCQREIDVPMYAIRELCESAVEEGLTIPPAHRELAEKAAKTGRAVDPVGTPLLQTEPVTIVPERRVARVGLFTGCLFDYAMQDVGRAGIDVLRRNRVEVVLPKDQVCCGMPIFWTGQAKLAKEHFVKRNIEAFERAGVDTVLTMCAACGMSWQKDVIPSATELLGREPRFRVVDIHRFLVEDIDLEEMGAYEGAKLTFHDPCHLRRGQGIWQEPRELLKKIPGIVFEEMIKADRCCGGVLRYSRPDIAYKIGEKKIEDAAKVKAGIIVTACPLCTNQLSMTIQAKGQEGIEVRNVVEIMSTAHRTGAA